MNELGGGPVRHVGPSISNAWPVRLRQAWPRHILGPTGLRVFQSVPSNVNPCAHLLETHSIVASSAAFLINNGALFTIGISMGDLPENRSAPAVGSDRSNDGRHV